jgi:hypothetical protein
MFFSVLLVPEKRERKRKTTAGGFLPLAGFDTT